jgi:hypothetical protein
MEKSSIVFSKNTRQRKNLKMMSSLGIRCEGRSGKYLGLPIYIGKSKAKVFAYIKDKIWKLIQGWNKKMFHMWGSNL